MRTLLRAVLIVLLCLSSRVFAQELTTQRFTSADGSFSFGYPVGWSIEVMEDSNLPNQIMIRPKTGDVEEDFTINISSPVKFYAIPMMKANTPEDMAAQGIALATSLLPPSVDHRTQISEFTVNNRPAAYGYSTMQVAGVEHGVLIIVVDVGDDYWATVSAISSVERLGAVGHVNVLRIGQSFQYTPPITDPVSRNPDLPWMYSGVIGLFQRGTIEFNYPEDWYVAPGPILQISNVRIDPLSTRIIPVSGQLVTEINGVYETRLAIDSSELDDECNILNMPWTAKTMAAHVVNKRISSDLKEMTEAGIVITQPEVVTVNGVEIAYFREIRSELETLVILVELGNSNIPMMRAITVRGEMAQFEDQLFQVASTFRYTPIIPETCVGNGSPLQPTPQN
jgi:hypothetical protein